MTAWVRGGGSSADTLTVSSFLAVLLAAARSLHRYCIKTTIGCHTTGDSGALGVTSVTGSGTRGSGIASGNGTFVAWRVARNIVLPSALSTPSVSFDMSNSAEQQAGGEQQQPGSDGEHQRTGIATDADAMRLFCTDLWIQGEKEALRVVRTESKGLQAQCDSHAAQCHGYLNAWYLERSHN